MHQGLTENDEVASTILACYFLLHDGAVWTSSTVTAMQQFGLLCFLKCTLYFFFHFSFVSGQQNDDELVVLMGFSV